MKWVEQNVSAQQFKAISEDIRRRTGVELASHEGEMEMRGFRFRFSYEEATQVLEFELKDKPWYVPEALIEAKVKEFLTGPG